MQLWDVAVDEKEQQELRERLLWRTVAKVGEDSLVLDDGTVLKLEGNSGCGGCSAGNYWLAELNDCPNAITAVDFETAETPDSDADDYHWEPDTVYRIFVYAENQRIKLAEFQGTDGNGYYGTGYWVEVSTPEA